MTGVRRLRLIGRDGTDRVDAKLFQFRHAVGASMIMTGVASCHFGVVNCLFLSRLAFAIEKL
jgi:hypothetical protein